MPFRIAEVEGSIPFESTIKITTPDGCGYFYGNRGNLKCSVEAPAGGTPRSLQWDWIAADYRLYFGHRLILWVIVYVSDAEP